jgi:hypothetical protein
MRQTFCIVLATLLLAATPQIATAQQAMTPQQYHKDVGPCACPGDKDKAGHACGKRSAFCKQGGAEVTCFRAGDVAKRKKDACS